jgi:hypothetical protein
VRHIALGASTHPFLRDHAISGTPVVPMAMVLEWFTAAALAWPLCPEVLVLRGISALRKIALPGFHGRRDALVAARVRERRATPPGERPRFPFPVQRRAWSVPRDLRPAALSSPVPLDPAGLRNFAIGRGGAPRRTPT